MGWFILAFGEGYIFFFWGGGLAMSERIAVEFFFSGGKAKWDESLKVQEYLWGIWSAKMFKQKTCPYNSSIETSIRIPGSTGASPYHRVFPASPVGWKPHLVIRSSWLLGQINMNIIQLCYINMVLNKRNYIFWLVVSTHLKNISQNGNLPQIGWK